MPLRTTIATVALLATPAIALPLAPIPAHAALQSTYEHVCPTYTHLPGRNLPIRDGHGNLFGILMIGLNWGNGRVCVATIKNDATTQWTTAYVENQSDDDLSPNEDFGNYQQYAGEPCTMPRPAKCSAIHARDGRTFYHGEVGVAHASGIYPWGSQ
jgi:hypothetical protein